MDMTKTNDKLVADYMASHRTEVADNGFSRRVMKRLPHRTSRLHRLTSLWNTACALIAVGLFIARDGFQVILHSLRETVEQFLTGEMPQLEPIQLIVPAAVLLFLGFKQIERLA